MLIVAAAGLALSGCQSAAFGVRTGSVLASQREPSTVEVNGILNAMREYLYDPYSVRDAEISKVIDLGGTATVCVKANAKNQMGGYIGRKTVMVYMNAIGKPFAINQDVYAVSGCNQLTYRRFVEIEQLKAL
ncbi:hypothetical protein SAMN05428953_10842 [Mesorhizobium muleiense]|uniref:Uncharacterized protein n=2 Tax=Mesorhizobium muleiense TaxID=1004279 RepID=A0A1G8VPW6_9HYPH|nr:hypothetical protein SAMN05428953_10842 [Mesorhizobium muleiense]